MRDAGNRSAGPETRNRAALQAVQPSVSEDLPSLSFLVVRLGRRLFALPTGAVERILRMAALVVLPGAPAGVAGALNLHGTLLPVVDPRPRLGITPVRIDARQILIVMSAGYRSTSAGNRYLVWVDAVERLAVAQPTDVDRVELGTEREQTPFVVRLDGLAVPVLSVEALDPGPIIRRAEGAP